MNYSIIRTFPTTWFKICFKDDSISETFSFANFFPHFSIISFLFRQLTSLLKLNTTLFDLISCLQQNILHKNINFQFYHNDVKCSEINTHLLTTVKLTVPVKLAVVSEIKINFYSNVINSENVFAQCVKFRI